MARKPKIGVIESIEEFSTDLETRPFIQAKASYEGEIKIGQPCRSKRSHTLIAELEEHGLSESFNIKPSAHQSLAGRQVWISEHVRP
jgi:hypothetical protein